VPAAFSVEIKRDYVRVSPRPNAEPVMRQLPSWIALYNEVTRTGSRIVRSVSSWQLTKHADRVRSSGAFLAAHGRPRAHD
jgi:hypothetical protein